MDTKGVKIKCRNCNRMASTDEFVLDPIYKMVVCKQCVKERQQRDSIHKEIQQEKEKRQQLKEVVADQKQREQKPVGWDEIDDRLEKMHKAKVASTVNVTKLDDDKVQYACPKCKYNFIYNTEKKTPKGCPYCSTPISNMMNIQ